MYIVCMCIYLLGLNSNSLDMPELYRHNSRTLEGSARNPDFTTKARFAPPGSLRNSFRPLDSGSLPSPP